MSLKRFQNILRIMFLIPIILVMGFFHVLFLLFSILMLPISFVVSNLDEKEHQRSDFHIVEVLNAVKYYSNFKNMETVEMLIKTIKRF